MNPELRHQSAAALSVEELRHRGALRSLAPAWASLVERSGNAGPFYQAFWFAVLASRLRSSSLTARQSGDAAKDAVGGRGELRLLVAHRRGVLEGALPLVSERRRIAGVPARVLRSLSDDHSQRFDVLAEGDAAIVALWRRLAADPSWDVLELRDLPEQSPAALRLVELATADGFPTGVWPSMRSPWFPLPATVAELDAALDARFRSNLRRRARRLAEELGAVALERVGGDTAAIDRALDEGFALEASGWKGRRGTAIALDPELRQRYRSLARALARQDQLALYFLVAGGRRVAFHFAAEAGGVYYLFKPGYDESLARFGLGHHLLYEVACDLVRRGAHEVDLLGDDMPWKRSWAPQLRPHVFRYVFRPTPFGRALWAWKFGAVPLARRCAGSVRRWIERHANRSTQEGDRS